MTNAITSELRGRWVLGISGASGMPYALKLMDVLSTLCSELHVVISDAALRVFQEEHYVQGKIVSEKISRTHLTAHKLIGRPQKNITFYNPKDIGASIASGSYPVDGMVVVPCSMGTLGAIANGLCSNLMHRAADVVLKEGRKLVIVPRETPLSLIHLENMTKLARCGAQIVPAMPGFYHQPEDLSQLVDMMVMKILDQMGYTADLVKRWGKDNADPEQTPVILELNRG